MIVAVVCCLVSSCTWLFCGSMDYSPPCSSVHGIFQARILEWIAIFSPGDLPNPRAEPASSASAGRFFTSGPWGNPKQDIHPCLKYPFLDYFMQLPTMDRHFLYMSIIKGSLKCFLEGKSHFNLKRKKLMTICIITDFVLPLKQKNKNILSDT